MLLNGHSVGQSRAEVLLTDDEFEDHASVRAFLDLAIEGSFPTAKPSADTCERSRALRRLVMLLLKYDCEALLVHIKLYLQRIERELHNASELFTIDAQMDIVESMRRTIEFFGDRVWSTQSGYPVAAPYDLNGAVSGASMLDISQSPAGAYSFVAPKYQAALLRAQALKRGGFRGTGGNWQAVSHAFRDIVTGKRKLGSLHDMKPLTWSLHADKQPIPGRDQHIPIDQIRHVTYHNPTATTHV